MYLLNLLISSTTEIYRTMKIEEKILEYDVIIEQFSDHDVERLEKWLNNYTGINYYSDPIIEIFEGGGINTAEHKIIIN